MKRVLFFLGQLNDRDVEWMTHNGNKIEVKTGTKLIEKDRHMENIYIVLDGQLSIYNQNVTNPIAKLGAGEILGEMSFLESRPPSVNVIADVNSRVFVISKKLIYERMNSYPEFRANFYYALALFISNRLRKTTDQLGYGNPKEEDSIDTYILDSVAQAGSRFSQILHRFSEV